MIATEYYRFEQYLKDKQIFFSFAGYISEGLLFSMGDVLKQKLASEETDLNTTKKVFSIFVEQVQNIIRYSSERLKEGAGKTDGEKKPEISSGVISVGSDGGQFFVVCGNTVSMQDAVKLRSRLELIQSLDKECIKAYYKEKLKEPPEAESKGASIGLLEIARRSSSPIEFDFMILDEQKTFFCIKAYI